jgi:hypothetical protein
MGCNGRRVPVGRKRGLAVWLWGQRHPVAIRLLAALFVLVVSVPAFVASELAGLRTVHVIYPRHTASVALGAGGYSLDQDPDATGFPVADSAIVITGPNGSVRAWVTAYDLSPADFGGPLLGLGTFAQAARFTVARPGVYRVSVLDPLAGARLFVSETYAASLIRSGPWLAAIIAALIALTITGMHQTKGRWPPGGLRRVVPARRGGPAGRPHATSPGEA